ncbi:putative splicing factor arginine/serine-rich 1 [Bienertia sinuspersici]
MSLHLANLSPRIRKDELEHVFRRFGRCMVQLKYGFGFAVYDFHGDAEKALRSLKGRKICGESVYLSWSNKQPKPLERFARAARSPDMPYGRNSVRRDSFVGRNISRSYGATSDRKQADKGRERPKFSEIHDDRPDFNHKNVGTVHYDRRDVILEAGGHLGVEPNPSDNGRWEERADICHNGTGSNGQMGFDRYMPDCAAEIGEKYENHGSEYLDGPQTIGTSPEKNRRVHPDKRRGQQTCFKCGAVGHKMRDCQLEEDLPEKRKYHSDYGHDRKGKNGVGKLDSESRSTGWLQSGHRNSRPARLHDTDRKLSYLEKSGVNSTSFPMANESGRDKNKDCNRNEDRRLMIML